MSSRKPPKKRGKRTPSGHQGRGAPQVSRAERRNAFALVAGTNSPEAGVIETVDEGPVKGVRMNRWLAERGVASRRQCDELIQSGGVEVNGEILTEMGYKVMPDDVIRVNGQEIKEVRRLYYLFYKPRGVICTADKRETRPRVGDLVDHLVPSRVYPVGRLDEDSEGLLLLTNDGDFAHMMMHPSFGVPKTYVVMVTQPMAATDYAALRSGAWIDGQKIIPEGIKTVRKTRTSTLLEVVIREGRNREVRRLFARHGFGVKRLKRVRIGSLGVKGIRRGGLRPLTRAERDGLVEVAKAPNQKPKTAEDRDDKNGPKRAVAKPAKPRKPGSKKVVKRKPRIEKSSGTRGEARKKVGRKKKTTRKKTSLRKKTTTRKKKPTSTGRQPSVWTVSGNDKSDR